MDWHARDPDDDGRRVRLLDTGLLVLRDERAEDGQWRVADWLPLPDELSVLHDLGTRITVAAKMHELHGGAQMTKLGDGPSAYSICSEARGRVGVARLYEDRLTGCLDLPVLLWPEIEGQARRWLLLGRQLAPKTAAATLADTLIRPRKHSAR